MALYIALLFVPYSANDQGIRLIYFLQPQLYMSLVGEGDKTHGNTEAIEGRGAINGKVVSVILLLCHKITVTLLVNRVMVQRRKKRQVTCLSKGEGRL